MAVIDQYVPVYEFARLAGVTSPTIYTQLGGRLKPYLRIQNGKKMVGLAALHEVYGITAMDDPEACIPKPDIKLDNNITRARTAVKELARCNDWDWFITLTLDPDKHDRYDLNAYHKQLIKFITNQNRSRDPDDKIRYILIPEKHKDGAWHMHGLLKGITEADDLYRNDCGYQSWRAYEKAFGCISISRIKDKDHCISYLCGFISKTLAENVQTLGAHLYYRSRGLKKTKIVPVLYQTCCVGDVYD